MGMRMPEKGDNGETPYGESDFRFEFEGSDMEPTRYYKKFPGN